MVSELETRARSAPQKVDVTALLQKQDEQYEGYLHLLHEYTEAKANLAKQMSNVRDSELCSISKVGAERRGVGFSVLSASELYNTEPHTVWPGSL